MGGLKHHKTQLNKKINRLQQSTRIKQKLPGFAALHKVNPYFVLDNIQIKTLSWGIIESTVYGYCFDDLAGVNICECVICNKQAKFLLKSDDLAKLAYKLQLSF